MNIDFKSASASGSHILSGSSLRNLWNLLADNVFRIERQYLPKLMQCALFAALNIPFALAESLLYNRRLKKTPIQPPVFILGYPRSGTTYLFYMLSKDPRLAFCKTYECMGPNVMFTFGWALRRIGRRALPKKRHMDNLPLGADLPKEEEFALCNMGIESMANGCYFPKRFSEYFDRFVLFNGPEREKRNWIKNYTWLLKKLTLKNRGKRLLLKSPFNTGRVKVLTEMFPEARFIHIHRHPYAVYSSNARLYEGILPKLTFHEIANHVFYTYKATLEQFFKEKSAIPKANLVEIAYEEFFDNQIDTLRRIYAQLELGDFETVRPIFEKEMRQYDDYQTNTYRLTPEKEAEVYDKWRFAFEVFGYDRAHHKRISRPATTTP